MLFSLENKDKFWMMEQRRTTFEKRNTGHWQKCAKDEKNDVPWNTVNVRIYILVLFEVEMQECPPMSM